MVNSDLFLSYLCRQGRRPRYSGKVAFRLSLVALAFLVNLAMTDAPAWANIPLAPVAVMTIDDDGRQLNYPHTVFYDKTEDEIYLVNGGTGRIVVYGPDFFPGMSIGVSRGVEAPRGGQVLQNGDIYLLQVRNIRSERPRITVLNAAFFVEREIFFDEIPQAADFSPRQIAISRDGLMYIAGSYNRGVLVLDNEGNFLRRLRPRDRTARPVPADELEESESAAEQEPVVAVDTELFEPATGDIPEEFRPRRGRLFQSAPDQDGLSPVIINHVTIDSNGRIYLLSAETSKVYVYGADETFLFSFGSKGGTPRHLSQPRAVAIDEQRGIIYVADYMRHTVLAYSMKGEYLFEFGGRGNAPGWFNFPEDMTINGKGQVIVADLFNRRVQVLEVKYDEFAPVQRRLLEERGAAVPVLSPRVQNESRSPQTEVEVPQVESRIFEPEDDDSRLLRDVQIEEIIIEDP